MTDLIEDAQDTEWDQKYNWVWLLSDNLNVAWKLAEDVTQTRIYVLITRTWTQTFYPNVNLKPKRRGEERRWQERKPRSGEKMNEERRMSAGKKKKRTMWRWRWGGGGCAVDDLFVLLFLFSIFRSWIFFLQWLMTSSSTHTHTWLIPSQHAL